MVHKNVIAQLGQLVTNLHGTMNTLWLQRMRVIRPHFARDNRAPVPDHYGSMSGLGPDRQQQAITSLVIIVGRVPSSDLFPTGKRDVNAAK